jgi:hypothetical protein
LVTKQAHKSGYIFGQGKDGKPPQQAAISVAFGRLMRDIGLEGVTHHALRHTGASAMVAAGISLRVVQDIGGWSTLRMLERYAHPSGAEMSRAVRVLTGYTTGTKTGTATKNRNGDPERTDAASAVKSAVRKWRPQQGLSPSGLAKFPAKCLRRPVPVKPRSGRPDRETRTLVLPSNRMLKSRFSKRAIVALGFVARW